MIILQGNCLKSSVKPCGNKKYRLRCKGLALMGQIIFLNGKIIAKITLEVLFG